MLHTRPLFYAPARGNPLEFRDETYHAKTRGMGLPYGENFIILISTVFVWTRTTHLTDRRTDGRTDKTAIAYTRYSMLSRVKTFYLSWSALLNYFVKVEWTLAQSFILLSPCEQFWQYLTPGTYTIILTRVARKSCYNRLLFQIADHRSYHVLQSVNDFIVNWIFVWLAGQIGRDNFCDLTHENPNCFTCCV